MQVSGERETDRALKRQDLSCCSRKAIANQDTVSGRGWRLYKTQKSTWVRNRLIVSFTTLLDAPGQFLTLLTDSKVVNAFHSAMALLGNIS